MKFKAEINVMPLKELLDPQGKAVSSSMKNIGLSEILDSCPTLKQELDAKGTEIETDSDPVIVENKKEDANASFYNALAEKMRNKFNN